MPPLDLGPRQAHEDTDHEDHLIKLENSRNRTGKDISKRRVDGSAEYHDHNTCPRHNPKDRAEVSIPTAHFEQKWVFLIPHCCPPDYRFEELTTYKVTDNLITLVQSDDSRHEAAGKQRFPLKSRCPLPGFHYVSTPFSQWPSPR